VTLENLGSVFESKSHEEESQMPKDVAITVMGMSASAIKILW
jgi:hypothetical protein